MLVVLVGVPTPEMELTVPLLDVFGRGGKLKCLSQNVAVTPGWLRMPAPTSVTLPTCSS